MKYLFIITGIAYGHLTREEAILNKLKKLDKKADITIAGYKHSYAYFKNDYKILKLNSVFFSGKKGKFESIKMLLKNYNLIFSWLNDIKIIDDFINEFDPDVVISDWEPFALLIRKCDYLIYNYKLEYSKANNLSIFLQKELIGLGYFIARIFGMKIILPSIEKRENIKNYIYTGLIVRKTPDNVKPLNEFKDSILVMIGGSDFGIGLAEKIKNISNEFKERFVFFGYKCRGKNCIGYNKFKDDYLEYLKSCKSVISLGGYSGISESLFFKKPNLAFPIKDQVEQQAVVEEFKEYIEIGDIESSEEELKNKIKKFLGNLDKMKRNLNKLKLTNGADEVAEIIYKKAKS